MKILIADKLGVKAINSLESMGAIITNKPDLTAKDISGEIDDNEILIVRSTKVMAEAIEKGASLSLIIRAGAGINTIDLETAGRYGISENSNLHPPYRCFHKSVNRSHCR